jgi:hypothetical protein
MLTLRLPGKTMLVGDIHNSLILLVSPAGFEPTTH